MLGEALREREEILRQLTESVHEVFWLVEIADSVRVLDVSAAFERVWGASIAELKEDPTLWIQGVHEDERETVRAAFKSLVRGEGRYDLEYRVVRRDGSIRWLWDRAFLIEVPDGRRRLAGMALDITKRKLAEDALKESEKRFKTVVDSLMDGAITCDMWGRVRLFNPAACRMFGYDATGLSGLNVRSLLSSASQCEAAESFDEDMSNSRDFASWAEPWMTE